MRPTSKPLLTSLLAFCLAAGAGAACLDDGAGHTDSQSHWLAACADDGDCGALSCTCSVCADPCAPNAAACGEGATCVPLDISNSACTTPAYACVPLCELDGCPNDGICDAGECIPRVPVVGGGDGGPVAAHEVRSESTGLIWSRCAGGETWTGTACTGAADEVGWQVAVDRCAQLGARLPTFEEAKALLGSCEVLNPEFMRPWVCSECAESPTCGALFTSWPVSGADEWTSTQVNAGSSAWGYSLSSGRVDDGNLLNAYYYRCVR